MEHFPNPETQVRDPASRTLAPIPAPVRKPARTPTRMLTRMLTIAPALVLILILMALPLTGCSGRLFNSGPLDVHHLQGRRIGVLDAWSPDYILEEYGGIDLWRFNTLTDALLALKYKRVEAIGMDLIDAQYLCSLQPAYQIMAEPVAEDLYVSFVTNGRPDLLAQFNEFAADFMQSAEYRDLVERVSHVQKGEFVSKEVPRHTTGPVLNLATSADAMPYTGLDFTTGDYIGSDTEVARLFAWRYGYQLNFLDSDYTGSVLNLTTGKADMYLCALSQAYRHEVELTHKALVSDPYFVTSIMLVQIGDRSLITFDNPDIGY